MKITDGHGPARTPEPLIPKHGGYRKLKSFQLAELIHDITVRFCGKYIERKSRTRDQMTQAARSGVQNIVEGSQVSGTSKKMEMKLTSVARASMEELRRDFKDYLRQNGLPELEPDHPALKRFRARRCSSMADFRAWVADEVKRAEEQSGSGEHGLTRTDTDGEEKGDQNSGPCQSVSVRVSPCSALCLCGQRSSFPSEPLLLSPGPST